MKITSRRTVIRLVSFVTAIIAVLGFSTFWNARKAADYKIQLQSVNERALNELGEYMDSIEVSLQKGMYVNTPVMAGRLSTILWRDATGAKSSLSQLPVAQLQLDNLYRFLSQVGEFAMTLSGKLERGEKLTDEERGQITKLETYARTLSDDLSLMCSALADGSFVFEQEKSTLNRESEELAAVFGSLMEDAEQSLVDYPTLIYDGPFSDHLMQRTPKMTQGVETVSLNEATRAAAKYSGRPEDQLKNQGDEDSTLPSYGFACGDITLSVTKQGGYLCYLLNPRFADETTLSPKDSIGKAQEYLASIGFSNLRESYYAINDGICVVNFAQMEGDTVCYPDLIKVSVAMDNGEIVGLDARGYLMNHTQRSLPAPGISYEEAKAAVSPNLTVLDSRMAVIPTKSGSEVFCYEFHCKAAEGQEVLVYIDAQTGFEADILLLTYQDNGVFTK